MKRPLFESFLAFQKPITIEDLDEADNHSDNKEEEEEDRGLSGMPIEEWLHDFEPPRLENKDKSALAKKSFKLSRIPIFEKGMFDFLESTTDPYYDGVVDYGDRAEHCWNGDQENPNYISRLRYNSMYVPKIMKRIMESAPKDADLTSWRYK